MSPISWKNLLKKISDPFKDQSFLNSLHFLEKLVAKVLSLALVFVIIFSVVELFILLIEDMIKTTPDNFFKEDLLNILGLFLNVLIALEVLENITVYLKKQTFLVELVVVTSLTAVARKIIIFDLKKYSSIDLIALSTSILALSISYWLLRRSNKSDEK